MSRTRIVLRTHDGLKLAELTRTLGWEFARHANDTGWFTLRVDGDFDPQYLGVDRLLEFWRQPVGAADKLLGVGLLRYWEWAENPETGAVTLQLGGPDQIDLLNRRIVAYNTPEANWSKAGYADDVMKEIVSENMGPTSTDPWYSRSRAYPADHFSIAPDEGKGRDIELQFQYRNVLQVLQELAAASAWPAQDFGWVSSSVYFDLECTGPAQFVFRTWSPLRGINRTVSGGVAPVVFSREMGNLANPSLRFDYTEEENLVYGLGPGTGTTRMVDPENDVPRATVSIWNLREGVAPATEEDTLIGIAWRSYNRMQAQRPQVILTGDLLDTPMTRFGVDWDFGDEVTVRYRGMEFDGQVDGFTVSVSPDGGDAVAASVRIFKALEGHPD